MPNEFDWHIDDEEEGPPKVARGTYPLFIFRGTLLALGLIVLIVAGWFWLRREVRQGEADLKETVQAVIDLERAAVQAGDGELFWSLQVPDDTWLSSRLTPEELAIIHAGLRVDRVEERELAVWANVTWSDGAATWQRVAFFEWVGDRLRQGPGTPNYWGETAAAQFRWGTITYHAVDADYVADIGAFIDATLLETCAAGCLPLRTNFDVVLAPNHRRSAELDVLRLPSPRLVALDEAGRPGAPFYDMLFKRLTARLTPTVIRIALSPPAANQRSFLNYPAIAARFMAAQTDIVVEFVTLEAPLAEGEALPADVDGAAFPPTVAMVAAGQVFDLTDYVNSDPDFDVTDFYEQMWQGALWRERMWFMPQAGQMRLLFYDRDAYRQAERPFPAMRWTWDEMLTDMVAVVRAQPAGADLRWGLLDPTLDTLYSYAYNWRGTCEEAAAVRCYRPLAPANVIAALEWYARLANATRLMPDISSFNQAERENILANWQSARRRAAVWVDTPVDFEHRLLLAPTGVVPFPGSDRFDGITPLWVSGSFISATSEQPLAVWQWLKFLSYEAPLASQRMVPARPSVANARQYWNTLPRPLADAMRSAFPFTRPVTIDEQAQLTWARVNAVMTGEMTPEQAAVDALQGRWFGVTPGE